MQKEETDRFDAVADDGDECTIIEYTKMISRTSLRGVTQRAAGAREYLTDTGLDVNARGGDLFEVVQTGKKFKRS